MRRSRPFESTNTPQSICFLAAVFLLFHLTSVGQVAPGLPSFSAYDRHEVDTVDLMNNNVLLTAPLKSKSGAMPFNLRATANSYMYTTSSTGGYWAPSMAIGAGMFSGAPFLPFVNGLLGLQTTAGPASSTSTTCSGQSAEKYSNWYVQTGDGTVHWLPSTDFTLSGSGSGCTTSITAQVVDGTGYTLSATTVWDGCKCPAPSATARQRHAGRTQVRRTG
jgi:hypothetical protein